MLGKTTLNLVNGSLRALTVPLKTPRMVGRHSRPLNIILTPHASLSRRRRLNVSASVIVSPVGAGRALSLQEMRCPFVMQRQGQVLLPCAPNELSGGLVKSTVHAD